MTQELMVAFMIVALVSGLLGVLGFTILNFRGERLAKLVCVGAAVTAVACWGMGLLPTGVIGVVLMLASGAVLIRFGMWLEPRLHDVVHRRRT